MAYEINPETSLSKYNVDAIAPLAAAIDSSIYSQKYMLGKPRFEDRLSLLSYAISRVSLHGLILEFGVNDGTTLNHIAERLASERVFGFDSFQGLPESWAGAPAGHFAQNVLPDVRPNVELVVGGFDKSLPLFLDNRQESELVAFLHIDCDLYASTQCVLAQLKNRIAHGTIIVFDEYFNYSEWRRHEHLALQEFVNQTDLKYEYIGLVPQYEHVAIRIM